MRVRWTPAARDDFRTRTRYIAMDNLTAARRMAQLVREATRRLGRDPWSGREGHVLDTRELVVPHTPFTLAYRVRGQVVEIAGVIHQSQEWPTGFD